MLKPSQLSGAVVALAILMAGCGDGDESSPSSTETSTTDQTQETTDPPSESPDTSERPVGDSSLTIDEPSNVGVELPQPVVPQELSLPLPDGSATVTARTYTHSDVDGDVGFNIFDTPPEQYNLSAGASGVAQSLGGSIESTTPIEVQGREGLRAVALLGNNVMIFQLVLLEDHVWQPYVAGPAADRDRLEASLDQLVDFANLG